MRPFLFMIRRLSARLCRYFKLKQRSHGQKGACYGYCIFKNLGYNTYYLVKCEIKDMSIKVKFFARLRDEIGRNEGEVEFKDGLSVSEIWSQLTDDAEMPESLMVAVNMEYVSGIPELKDGDEIAFFPPVTGG